MGVTWTQDGKCLLHCVVVVPASPCCSCFPFLKYLAMSVTFQDRWEYSWCHPSLPSFGQPWRMSLVHSASLGTCCYQYRLPDVFYLLGSFFLRFPSLLLLVFLLKLSPKDLNFSGPGRDLALSWCLPWCSHAYSPMLGSPPLSLNITWSTYIQLCTWTLHVYTVHTFWTQFSRIRQQCKQNQA